MKFCPKCEVKLKKNITGLQCSKCGYTEGETVKQTKKIISKEEPDFSLLAFEGDEGEESYSTIKMDCGKCGHDQAIWWMFQT
ncbi:MAG: transcription factor S, partial [Nitrosopumilus sp.]